MYSCFFWKLVDSVIGAVTSPEEPREWSMMYDHHPHARRVCERSRVDPSWRIEHGCERSEYAVCKCLRAIWSKPCVSLTQGTQSESARRITIAPAEPSFRRIYEMCEWIDALQLRSNSSSKVRGQLVTPWSWECSHVTS